MPVRRGTREKRSADDSYETAGDETFDEDFDEDEESHEDLSEEDLDEEEEDEDEEDEDEPAKKPRRRSSALSAATAGAAGLRHIADLTSKETEGVTLVRRAEDGWLVEVEVVESRHIPSSGDMLSLYQIELDATGDLLSYRRVKRYRRGRADSAEGG
ncbi:gas vesicle protein GvpO [Streptosporangium sp. NPDC006930]|uniref:gas vesicle protein GvpO n=1 Tax=unclassified Streptosporangium TaxID=2632669 RepID=UPI00342D9FF3